MVNFILIVLAAVAAILYTVMVFSYRSDKEKQRSYRECTGTIQRIWKRPSPVKSGKPRYIISPIIQYTVCGKAYELVGNDYSKGMEAGQAVPILYDPTAPAKAIMKTGLFGTSLVTGLVGLFFTMGFIILAVLKYAGLVSF